MEVLALKVMIVIQPVCTDERGAAFSVLGQNLLGVLRVDLFSQVHQFGPGSGQRDNVLC